VFEYIFSVDNKIGQLNKNLNQKKKKNKKKKKKKTQRKKKFSGYILNWNNSLLIIKYVI